MARVAKKTKFIQDKKTGKFKGSLGAGRHGAPSTSSPVPPAPVKAASTSGWNVKYDKNFTEGVHYENFISREGIAFRKLTAAGRQAFCAGLAEIGPPTDWHPELMKFARAHGIEENLPGKSSLQFYMINVLASHRFYGFHRGDLNEIRGAVSKWFLARPEAVNRPSQIDLLREGDAIQLVNKTGQWGLVHQSLAGEAGNTYYRLDKPFGFKKYNRKSQGRISIGSLTREEQIARQKAFFLENWVNVPDEKWQVGHADPRDPSSVFMQPPLQASYRDRYLWDPATGLPLAPTVDELIRNRQRYYSTEDINLLTEAWEMLDNLKDESGEANE